MRARSLPVKWVRPESIHLTLKFLGDVDEATEPNLVAALGQAAGDGEGRPLTMQIEGFGASLELLQHRVALDLMESTLQSGGAVYQVKHRGRLS